MERTIGKTGLTEREFEDIYEKWLEDDDAKWWPKWVFDNEDMSDLQPEEKWRLAYCAWLAELFGNGPAAEFYRILRDDKPEISIYQALKLTNGVYSMRATDESIATAENAAAKTHEVLSKHPLDASKYQ